MTSYLFNTTVEGWDTSFGFAWSGTDGSPVLGCIARPAGSALAITSSITSLSIPVSVGDPISFRFRLAGQNSSCLDMAEAILSVKDSFANVLGYALYSAPMPTPSYDTGWVLVSGTISTAGTAFTLTTGGGCGLQQASHAYSFDSVYIAESPPAADEIRLLGMDADTANLYVTGIQATNLSLLTYPLATLSSPGTATFGTAAYTDPDTFIRGIYPVVKPAADKIVYLRGRDGNNKQVQYNDLNGTAGWVDVGAGTATWGTSKFAIALMPWPTTPNNLVVAFSDDDVYQTPYGTSGWVKNGDAVGGLRTMARMDTEGHKLLGAGTAAGTLLFTQNYGVSFGSGTAAGTAAGTINAIEFSI